MSPVGSSARFEGLQKEGSGATKRLEKGDELGPASAHHAARLGGALKDVEDGVAPHDPARKAPPEREGQDDGRHSRVGECDGADEHESAAQLAAHADVEVRVQRLHFRPSPLRLCAKGHTRVDTHIERTPFRPRVPSQALR